MVPTRTSLTVAVLAAVAACAEPKTAAPEKVANADDAAHAGVTKGADAGVAVTVADASAPPDADPVAHADADAGARAEADPDANAFTLRLYGAMRKTAGNLFVSGTSLRSALGITYLGARGQTAREMATALALPRDASAAAAHAKEENAAWQAARGKAELVVANRVWIDKTVSLDARYAAMADDAYGAAPAPLDFKTKPEEGRRAINAWVAEKTKDKIVDLIPNGAIEKSSRVIVTNAIYFKDRWALPFSKSETKNEPFEIAPSKSKTVPMMHALDSYAYGETADAKVLEIHYEGSSIAMMIVLPNDRAGLSKIEEKLDAATYDSWTKALKHRRVQLSLPKWTFTSGGPMTAPLRELGMVAAFTTRADFAGIAPEKIQIDQVVQKTYVAVDENGTEAAAASGVLMRTTSLPLGGPAEFKADHPFLFFLHDGKKGTILFAGRVSDPK